MCRKKGAFLIGTPGNSIDNLSSLIIIKTNAGVVKLVDAEDSKSSGPRVRVGSIPTSGT